MMIPLQDIALAALPGLALPQILDVFLQVFFVMLRIGAFALSAPFFGSRLIALPVRIVFTGLMAFFIYPRTTVPPVEVLQTLAAIGIIAHELAIGLAAGLTLTILFASVSLAGEKIASTSGLSFAAQVDPNGGGQTPVVSQAFNLLLIALFLSLNGHVAAIALVVESYAYAPIGGALFMPSLVEGGMNAASQMFRIAASIMFPVAGILLLVNFTIGIITRSAPQLNLFSFGFPITLLTVFVVLFLFIGPLGAAFADLIQNTLQLLATTLRGISNG